MPGLAAYLHVRFVVALAGVIDDNTCRIRTPETARELDRVYADRGPYRVLRAARVEFRNLYIHQEKFVQT